LEIVSSALVHAKLGDLTQLPTLFAYLTFLGRYFRSGYQKAEISWYYEWEVEIAHFLRENALSVPFSQFR
jgi:hypothetical protein